MRNKLLLFKIKQKQAQYIQLNGEGEQVFLTLEFLTVYKISVVSNSESITNKGPVFKNM